MTRSASRAIDVRGERAGHADGAEVLRMIVAQRAFAGLRLAHRDARLRGELRQRLVRFAVEHAAARNDQRFLARANQFHGAGQQRRFGRRPRDVPDPILEQLDRVIEGFGLHILRQAPA